MRGSPQISEQEDNSQSSKEDNDLKKDAISCASSIESRIRTRPGKSDELNGKDEVDRKPDERDEESIPPALPPRPPPRPRQATPCNCTCECAADNNEIQPRFRRRPPRSCWSSGLRKYVFLCTSCGSLSVMLGALFLIVYFMLKSYTSSHNYFETIPTYIPSAMLMATGFLITCLACRKNRNSFLMKLCGVCSLCCAVLCITVTVTTTVIHMNRLQTLRECLFTQRTNSCTCFPVLPDNDKASDEGVKFVFNSMPDCGVIHGALYSCLRAIFGLSVIGILICIFSCMLVYQLARHEKKKMYWAQIEMRCRYLYRQRNPHYCSCCDECRYPPPPHELFPWELMGNRLWSTARVGNLYTPNPEDRGNHNRLRTGWNWRRLPWNRGGANGGEPARANLGSPDSQYGFSSSATVDGGTPATILDPMGPSDLPLPHPGIAAFDDFTEGGFYSWGPPPTYASNVNSANNSPAGRSLGDLLHQVSPIRRNDNVSPVRPFHHVYHHHLHHNHNVNHQCLSATRQVPPSVSPSQPNSLQKVGPARTTPLTNAIQQQQSGLDAVRSNSLTSVHRYQKVIRSKDNYENTYESNESHSSGFNTLPSSKKRSSTRVSDVFHNESTGYGFSSTENLQGSELPPRVYLTTDISEPPKEEYRMGIPRSPNIQNFQFIEKNETEPETKILRNLKLSKDPEFLQRHGSVMKELNKRKSNQGIENEAFDTRYLETERNHENESDVYFGDISNSSCYMSIQNEGSVYEETLPPKSKNLDYSNQNSNRFRPIFREANDEQSSSSMTADSGFEKSDEKSSSFETLNEKFTKNNERFFSANMESLGDFSHPLFQKPRRYDGSESGEEESNSRIANKLLNTCSLSLSQDDANTSPKPTPRTSLPKKHYTGQYLAPDAQYQENYQAEAAKRCKSSGKSKPAVPARSLNLQNVSQHRNRSKMESVNIQMMRPIPRRRQNVAEGMSHCDKIEIGSHSVNV